jgi:glycosyltransferase involved in cell wall biosynthesis
LNPRVVLVQETMPGYRVPLISEIRKQATDSGIEFEVVYGRAPGRRGSRLNTGHLTGAAVVRNRYVPAPGANGAVVWQPALRRCLSADLVVVEQANRLLLNYLLLIAQRLNGPRVAFWGHGRNFQELIPTASERLKARMASSPWWWFAYTDAVAQYVASCGFAPERITVVGNTIDVHELRAAVEEARRIAPAVCPQRCAYLGGLDLLLEASDLIARSIPNFELVIAGDGEQRDLITRFVATRPWAKHLGSVEGSAKAELLASCRLLLMPGAVGLGVLDSFAAGVPLVTTANALHGPEIDYLKHDMNGVILNVCTPPAYAGSVIRLLRDENSLQRLGTAAKAAIDQHRVVDAAGRFVDGLRLALGGARSS